MKFKHHVTILLTSLAFSAPAIAAEGDEKETASEFLSKTIDIGCVVSDIDKSVKFYTQAIGFKEVAGFKVGADFAKKAGLTDKKNLDIRVLVLGEGEGATKLKLMQIKGGGNKKADHAHIDTTLGLSYITIVVKSTDEALKRLAEAKVKPIARGPVTLPKNLNPALSLTIVRDPDGNLVELVGPKPTK